MVEGPPGPARRHRRAGDLSELIVDVLRDPFVGISKPEPLEHILTRSPRRPRRHPGTDRRPGCTATCATSKTSPASPQRCPPAPTNAEVGAVQAHQHRTYGWVQPGSEHRRPQHRIQAMGCLSHRTGAVELAIVLATASGLQQRLRRRVFKDGGGDGAGECSWRGGVRRQLRGRRRSRRPARTVRGR